MDQDTNIENRNADEAVASEKAGESTAIKNGLIEKVRKQIKGRPLPEDQTYYEKKMLFHSRLRSWCTAIIALVFLAIGFFIISIAENTISIIREAEGAFNKLNTIAAEFEEVDFPVIFDEVNKLIMDGQTLTLDASESMGKALEKVESLDIDTLNQSIEDFSAVVEPLSQFFGK